MSKSIIDLLQLKTDELHFIYGALNNLELVLVAQESQKEDGWVHFTGNVIRDLKDRASLLERHVRSLKQEVESLASLDAHLGALAAEAPPSKPLSWN
jgi:hypothetical protein